MPILLDHTLYFPEHDEADEHGVIAVGGDLSPPRVLSAYYAGIFPWPHKGLPLLWFSPDPRFVLDPKKIIINRSLVKAIKSTSLHIEADKNFRAVMKGCQKGRADKQGTWISNEMIDSYEVLHHMGYAHSIEAYREDTLVGGLYGISIGSMFFGESMFFIENNASKIAFVSLIGHLLQWNFSLVDCQSHTEHLEKFGAYALPRQNFLDALHESHKFPTIMGPWVFTLRPNEALKMIQEKAKK